MTVLLGAKVGSLVYLATDTAVTTGNRVENHKGCKHVRFGKEQQYRLAFCGSLSEAQLFAAVIKKSARTLKPEQWTAIYAELGFSGLECFIASKDKLWHIGGDGSVLEAQRGIVTAGSGGELVAGYMAGRGFGQNVMGRYAISPPAHERFVATVEAAMMFTAGMITDVSAETVWVVP